MAARRSNWKSILIVVAWLAVIIYAFIRISRPEPIQPPPTGWTIWRGMGAVRALILEGNYMYAGGPEGLYKLNMDGSYERINIPGVQEPIVVNAFLRDMNGLLWVCHDQGICIEKPEGWVTLTKADGLPEGRIAIFTPTKDGFVWIGTENGAVRLPMAGPWVKSSMNFLTTDDGLMHNRIASVVEDNDGGLWFGNYAAPEGGLNHLVGGQFSYWTPGEGLPHPNVLALYVTRDGCVWAGCGLYTVGGGAIFNKGNNGWVLEETLSVKELAGPIVRSICEDSSGRMWIGSEYDGLTIRKGNDTLRTITLKDGLPASEVLIIVQADDGAMWLGTTAGAVCIAPVAIDSLLRGG